MGGAAVLKGVSMKKPEGKKLGQAVKLMGEHKVVEVGNLDPNPWNPNHLSPDKMKKLTKGLREVRKQSGSVPPITVRENPDHEGRYQIIDGEHRWRVFKSEGWNEMDCFVIKADDALAKWLTLNLNYLRGEPDEKQEADVLAALVKDGFAASELADILYLSEDQIVEKLQAYENNDALSDIFANEAKMEKKEDVGTLEEDGLFTDLHFRVSVSQARIIEKEVNRITEHIKGKNSRGRALELMAVNSSQDPLPEV